MTETFDGVDTKQRIRDMWASVAPGWEAYADANDDRGAALTDRILDGTGVQAGHRVLELASGPGGTGLAAAERVGAGGGGGGTRPRRGEWGGARPPGGPRRGGHAGTGG